MTKYRQWVLKYLLLSAAIIFIYLGLVYSFYSTPQYSLWIDNCLNKKEFYAASIEDRKIVFVSGSNTLFGIRSADVEKHFGLPAVNLAVHYGLQIDYILDRAKRVIKSGDIVILPLEYSHYDYDGVYSFIQSSYVRTYDRGYFDALPLRKRLKHLLNTTPVDLIKAISEQVKFRGEEEPPGQGVYNSKTLNQNGDQTYGAGPLLDRLRWAQPILVPATVQRSYGTEQLLEFNNWCHDHGVLLCVTWPNVMKFDAYSDAAYVDFFESLKKFFEDNGVLYFGLPEEAFFEKQYMYDGVYHLNQKGIDQRTNRIIQQLKTFNPIQLWLHSTSARQPCV